MKTLLLSILLILGLSFFSPTQSTAQQTITYSNWQLSNDGCWGCASFYWSIVRTAYPDSYGYYYYYTYFYSNSFYINGEWASTYVSDIYLYVDDNLFNSTPVYITFKEQYSPSLLWFKTKNSNASIYLKWGGKQLL